VAPLGRSSTPALHEESSNEIDEQANLLLALVLNPRQAEHKRRIIFHWRDLLHFG